MDDDQVAEKGENRNVGKGNKWGLRRCYFIEKEKKARRNKQQILCCFFINGDAFFFFWFYWTVFNSRFSAVSFCLSNWKAKKKVIRGMCC